METLEEILEFAIGNNACEDQVNSFRGFIESGDTLSAWGVVVGNWSWLSASKIPLEFSLALENAKNIGKTWYSNGQLRSSVTYVDGKEVIT